jgi:hypothetical protein
VKGCEWMRGAAQAVATRTRRVCACLCCSNRGCC